MREVFIQADKKHPLRCAVYDRFRSRNPLESKKQSYSKIASEFGISVPTVQRYIRRMEQGIFYNASRKQGRTVYAWDNAALSFFTMFYLTALKEVGECSIRNAYHVTREEAIKNGWHIGSEASAYIHARQISPAMKMLAKGGQRALDNMFYISRDLSKLRPFQLIVGDQHRFDFWCVDPDNKGKNDEKLYIRAECYLWLDMATRMVYGISFDRNYSTRTVTRALRTGIQRFGKFESTYNDNGSSEKSAIADNIVHALQSYGVRFIDEADLYHTENGRYIVEDTEGELVDIARTKAEWEQKHRRIFARVKNAKTKPIERFFSTLEQILRDMITPGFVKEMGLSATEEEQAKKRLDWQKRSGYILSFDQFIQQVVRAIDIYEGRVHTTLGCSPRQRLDEYIRNGWQPTFIDKRDESYLFMESRFATVQGDRVQIDKKFYIGPDLTQEMVLQNRGTLTAYNKQKIEIRFDPENLDLGVFAIEPGTKNAIALRPVEQIDMTDREAMLKKLEWKKRNIRAVQAAFDSLTKNKSVRVLSEPEKFAELRNAEGMAERALADGSEPTLENPRSRLPARTESKLASEFVPTDSVRLKNEIEPEEWRAGLAELLGKSDSIKAESKAVYMTEADRYEDIFVRCKNGGRISKEELDFKFAYEAKMNQQERSYYETRERLDY